MFGITSIMKGLLGVSTYLGVLLWGLEKLNDRVIRVLI